MGMSTNALLWFGYCWTKLDEPPWADHEDQVGGNDIIKRFIFRSGLQGSTPAEVHEAFIATGCEVLTHCAADSPMYGVALSSTVFHAWRGSPCLVKAAFIESLEEAKDKLTEFCTLMGISTEGAKLGWWLASDWS